MLIGHAQGRIHRGGVDPLFLVALAMLLPVFVFLRRSEIANRSIPRPT